MVQMRLTGWKSIFFKTDSLVGAVLPGKKLAKKGGKCKKNVSMVMSLWGWFARRSVKMVYLLGFLERRRRYMPVLGLREWGYFSEFLREVLQQNGYPKKCHERCIYGGWRDRRETCKRKSEVVRCVQQAMAMRWWGVTCSKCDRYAVFRPVYPMIL